MADYDDMTPGEVLADASVADFIASLGRGIAEAQQDLDRNSIEQLDSFTERLDGLGGKSLMELGFSPAFYHYQHADLSCSLNIRLKVEKETGFDLGITGAFGQTDSSAEAASSSSTETASGSRTESALRTADIELENASAGRLEINGSSYQSDADDGFMDRASDLAEQLRSGGLVDAVQVIRKPSELSIESEADPDRVAIGRNTVAFVARDHPGGLIRLDANEETTIKLDGENEVTVSAKDDLAAFADAVGEAIENLSGYKALVLPPGKTWLSVEFKLDGADVPADEHSMLDNVAWLLKQVPALNLQLLGHADRTGHEDWSKEYKQSYNLDLSRQRAEAVEEVIRAFGPDLGDNRINSDGEGEARAVEQGNPTDHQPDRVVEIAPADDEAAYILVESKDDAIADVSPDRKDGSDGNGWLGLFAARSLSDLDGDTVTIEGESISLSGDSVGDAEDNSPEAFAANLATKVNDEDDLAVVANARGRVCHLAPASDAIQLHLVTSSKSDIQMSSSEGVTVKEQFSRTSSERKVQQRSGNRTVAVGASVDVRYSRQFELDVTGNSSITARLVSVPAPPEFLDTMREFLKD
ncbi:OmpA family protein [Methylonatrum kenyense]|uniref:OmpA family protein n=1 Tax=Methylonatrum kenyense TaxID=455253 RepID=UPI0020BE922A|nr:OmpA family protein [Methylonatrum kenyense]MCK8515364.1 OmpA family protein [Methylonatrum kenyense]